MCELALDNEIRYAMHSISNVREQSRLLAGIEQVEEGARLAIVVVSFAVVVTVGIPADLERWFSKIGTLDGSVERVRLVIGVGVRTICEESHLSVLVIVMHGALGSVHRQCLVVSTQAVAMGVRV